MTLHVAVSGWLLGPPSGANRRLLALLAAIGPELTAGERITVLHAEDVAPPRLPGIGWQPIAIPRSPTLRRAFAERRVLPEVVRALGANVLDHGFLPTPRVAVPVCLLVHDTRALEGLTRWPRGLARAVLRRSLARAAAVVTPSNWTAEQLRRCGTHTPLHVVRNGVVLPKTPSPEAPTRLPPHGYLLHVGHVEARKNLEVVVHALAVLPVTERPELWLAGADAGALTTLQHAAQSAGIALRSLGAVDDAQLAQLYAHARAVVMPSRHEGFGLPALEGLAHGRPVLASDAGALPEVLGPCGRTLPAHEPAAWAAAFAALPRHAAPDPQSQARAATFGWAEPGRQLLALWRSLAR